MPTFTAGTQLALRTFTASLTTARTMKTVDQTSTEALPYTCNIEPSALDSVSTATWTIDPTNATVGAPANTLTSSTVVVSGLIPGQTYMLMCHIVGTSGAQYDGDIQISAVLRRY